MATKILVANSKGGVGKTTLSICIADATTAAARIAAMPDHIKRPYIDDELVEVFKSAGAGDIELIDLDAQPGQDVSKSSLSRVFPKATPFHIHADQRVVAANPKKATTHFDGLGAVLLNDEPVLIDFGANTIEAVLAWADESGIGTDIAANGNTVKFVVPITEVDPAAWTAMGRS